MVKADDYVDLTARRRYSLVELLELADQWDETDARRMVRSFLMWLAQQEAATPAADVLHFDLPEGE